MGSSGLWRRSSEELFAELRDVETQMRQLYAASVELIAELDSRDVVVECGYRDLPGLLRDVLRIGRGEARRRVEHARSVAEVPALSGGSVSASLPLTAAALRAGELGAEHVQVIRTALADLPAHVPDADRATAEETLVTAARSLDAGTLSRVATRLPAVLDQDGTPPDDRELAQPANELHLTTRANGRMAGRFELAPEPAALLQALLGPLAKPRPSSDTGPDPRTAAERNGDALAEILNLAADAGTAPTEAGERPHLTVTISLDELRAELGRPGPGDAELGHAGLHDAGLGHAILGGAGRLDAASARRLACDSRIIPAVLGTNSEPLDIGRSSYTVPTALRRALILRDQGCASPGCDRPPRQCHAHHIRHWADGGPTDLANLVLLCGHHHRLIHHSDWRCAITNGRAEFIPPRFVDPRQVPRVKMRLVTSLQ